MPSKDLLEKLFDVEHEAETMVTEAREKAGRRLDEARTSAQARLADLLVPLSTQQCETVFQALQIIQPLFLPAGDKILPGETKI